jgi:hypothetical protein
MTSRAMEILEKLSLEELIKRLIAGAIQYQ